MPKDTVFIMITEFVNYGMMFLIFIHNIFSRKQGIRGLCRHYRQVMLHSVDTYGAATHDVLSTNRPELAALFQGPRQMPVTGPDSLLRIFF